MEQESIYGQYEESLEQVMNLLKERLEETDRIFFAEHGEHIYEHISARVKSDASMREKLERRGLPQTPRAAMKELTDSVGLRIVCAFIDDIYAIVDFLKGYEDIVVKEEKDYIRHSKDNGYRSYHMILEMSAPYEDVEGNNPGKFYIEIQLRTIAMDSWASLEHKLKYKKDIPNQELIVSELKRCADEMMSCDLSMQTIRDLIMHES
ncbi:MAG: GTP pyrophosphokinase family protein [Lachnospiraceae bacterium]|nr:GTP pyrophosphokinase family protein [Lachnospiraceae bacterium]